MTSTAKLLDFYYKDLSDTLERLETQRRGILRKLRNVLIALAAVVVLVFIVARIFTPRPEAFVVAAAFVALAVGGFVYRQLSETYRLNFKRDVIRPLIRAVSPSLRYDPEGKIPQELFEYAGLFDDDIDRYEGNDFVEGIVEGTSLAFSDVYARRRDTDDKGRETWTTIFRGLFIVADANKHFSGRTVVLPDRAEKLLGSYLGNMLQASNFTRDSLIKMDDPAFEKAFAVYGNDSIETHYLLSHSMMQRLLDLRNSVGEDVYVAFKGDKIFIAVAYDKDLFEPSLFESLFSMRQAMEFIGTLKQAVGIVEELRLNEKLWSKP